jgi:hypothetical protein
MNAAQRKILVRTLFVLAALSAGLSLFAIVVGQADALFDDILWNTPVAPVAFVLALYLRAGGAQAG